MKTYYVTFGRNHRRGEYKHEDGWVEIQAEGLEQARNITISMYAGEWAFIYTDDFEPKHHPKGCLLRVAPGPKPSNVSKYIRELMKQLETHGNCTVSYSHIGESAARTRIMNAAKRCGYRVTTKKYERSETIVGTIVSEEPF